MLKRVQHDKDDLNIEFKMQKYSVNQHLIETLLTWVKSGEIAIPEIQPRSCAKRSSAKLISFAFSIKTINKKHYIITEISFGIKNKKER